MDFIHTYPLYALIASNSVLLLGAALAMLRFERLVKRNLEFWNSPTGVSTRGDGNSEREFSGSLDRRLATLQDRLDALANYKEAKAGSQSAEMPFEHAIQMAKRGATVGDLIRTFGLARSEAELMRRLHARRDEVQPTSTH